MSPAKHRHRDHAVTRAPAKELEKGSLNDRMQDLGEVWIVRTKRLPGLPLHFLPRALQQW